MTGTAHDERKDGCGQQHESGEPRSIQSVDAERGSEAQHRDRPHRSNAVLDGTGAARVRCEPTAEPDDADENRHEKSGGELGPTPGNQHRDGGRHSPGGDETDGGEATRVVQGLTDEDHGGQPEEEGADGERNAAHRISPHRWGTTWTGQSA